MKKTVNIKDIQNSQTIIVQELLRSIRIKYNLPPERPTSNELVLIVTDILQVPENQRTEKIWKSIVYKHVRFNEQYIYKGLDFSDINLLLSQLLLSIGGE